MKKRVVLGLVMVVLAFCSALIPNSSHPVQKPNIISVEIKPSENLKMYWRDSTGKDFRTLGKLEQHIQSQGKQLQFAMNGGMYTKEHKPLGLFIHEGKTLQKMNTKQKGYGNFYMQPNGVFYIKNDLSVGVVKSTNFSPNNVKYATQSGPMLLVDGQIHSAFKEGSFNIHIRNGVGVLPNGNLLFAISKNQVNLYDFASYFLAKGCKNALYLDGAVSKAYMPDQGHIQKGGDFSVIIGQEI